jgi:inner membrane protein
MDPVCHTLVGGAIAQTGLKQRSALGTATLLLGANLPDIDVLSYAWDPVTALWFRRGVTHGVIGLAVLPLVLAGVMILWDRLVRRRGGKIPERPVVATQIVLLSFVATLTHPVLDFLNTYGMRWFVPFSMEWVYGDTLFIVDPWVWGVLAVGIYAAWRREAGSVKGEGGDGKRETRNGRPAVTALAVVAGYILVMAASNVIGRGIVTRSLLERGFDRPTRLMVAPVPVTPFRRWVVIEDGDTYRFGRLNFLQRPMFELDEFTIDAEPDWRAVAATRGPRARKFQSWARFPYYVVERRGDKDVVFIGDARYTLDPPGSWAAVAIPSGR